MPKRSIYTARKELRISPRMNADVALLAEMREVSESDFMREAIQAHIDRVRARQPITEVMEALE